MDINKRFDRIIAIYFQLQARPVVKAQELADKFGVSLRTIYRDIKSLENAGIPIYSEAGTGYALMNSYRIPPTLFSKEEAMSFAVAEKLMQHYVDADIATHFTSALLKMKAVLRHSDKEDVAHMESKVVINNNQHFLNPKVPSALSRLFESIARKVQVEVLYQSASAGKAAPRVLEAVGVFQENEFWYFMAYCHNRKEIRQFRLDRIQQINLKDTPVSQSFKPLSFYLEKRGYDGETQKVRIWVSRHMARFLYWERKYYGFIAETDSDDGIEMLFECRNINESFARWFLMFADEARIIEPLSLKIRIKEIIESYNQKLQEIL